MNQPQFFKLVSIHNAKDKTVRHRVCHHISGVMGELKEDMEIDDELWQGLQAALLMRCRDKIAAVRAVAASAMVRLQVRESLGRCPNCCQSRTHAHTLILEHRRSSWRAPRPHVQRVGKM